MADPQTPGDLIMAKVLTASDAETFAQAHHAGQVDKAGRPYIDHLCRVAVGAARRARTALQQGIEIDPDAVMQAGWLHDVVEDTPVTPADLLAHGFAPNVVAMVELLTKPAGPGTYVEKLRPLLDSGNLGALLVKLADNEDNTSPDRLHPNRERLDRRYAAARVKLILAASMLGYQG